MKILTLGDVVSPQAIKYLTDNLWTYRSKVGADFVIVNGENASEGNGLSTEDAMALLDAGADVLTGGNHTLRRKNLRVTLDTDERILRPANLPAHLPGSGYGIYNAGGIKVLVMNVMGQVYLTGSDDPFSCADRILKREAGGYDVAICDIHAEATSEKIAFARYLDGRVSGVFGTHTHVQTADEQILPSGTGYITDLGFTGVQDSVLGVKSEIIIDRFVNHSSGRFESAQGTVTAHGALFTVDENNGKCTAVERIKF